MNEKQVKIEKYLRDNKYTNIRFLRMDGKYFIYQVDSFLLGTIILEMGCDFFGITKKKIG